VLRRPLHAHRPHCTEKATLIIAQPRGKVSDASPLVNYRVYRIITALPRVLKAGPLGRAR
jgi:hypothetical protein